MTPETAARSEALLAKAKLTVDEMTQLIAYHMVGLPTVRSVAIADLGELAVDLVGGKRIEVMALPVAHAFNESFAVRRQTLDTLIQRCG